jgi:hypothetical protein
MSTGYYKVCTKCGRRYGRHFQICIDCTPRAKPNNTGLYNEAYRTKYGIFYWGKRVNLNFCSSKDIPIELKLKLCDTCRVKYKCYTEE